MRKKKKFWQWLSRLMNKKEILIVGNASELVNEQEMEILEGEETPVRVYFDKNSEYEIIEREISPSKISCPGCGRKISHGMDYCNFCGTHVTEETEGV